MRDGEHRAHVGLQGQKFYVIGRARYKPFEVDSADAEAADYRNILPLDAAQAYKAIQASLEAQGLWDPVEAYFRSADGGPEDGAAEAAEADGAAEGPGGAGAADPFRGFLSTVWAPTVRDHLVAHSGLTASEHAPLLTTGGHFCFDVKLARLMSKKGRQLGYNPDAEEDLDINGNITRTRAAELLRILHTKLSELPNPFIKALFRGQEAEDGSYPGIQSDVKWPDNDSDEPFASAPDAAFRYHPDYSGAAGAGGAPAFRVVERPWGLLLAVIKPGAEADFETSDGSNWPEAGAVGAPAAEAVEESPAPEEESPAAADLQGGLEGGQQDGLQGLHQELKGQAQGASPWGSMADLSGGGFTWLRAGNTILGYSPELIGGKTPAMFVRAHRYGPEMASLITTARKSAPGPVVVWFPPAGTFKTEGYYGSANAMNAPLMAPWVSAFGATHGSPSFKRPLDPQDFGLRGGHFLYLE